MSEAEDRLHRFAVEWKLMQQKSSYGPIVYELHSGDPRHAECRIDDIIALLSTQPRSKDNADEG